MANSEETQKTPEFLKRFTPEERDEFLVFMRNQIRLMLEQNSDFEKRSRDLVRSEGVSEALDRLVEKTGDNRGDLLQMALTLYEIVIDAVNKGQRLALLGPDYRFIREIVGFKPPKSEVNEPETVAR
jgi:hypothetical protein